MSGFNITDAISAYNKTGTLSGQFSVGGVAEDNISQTDFTALVEKAISSTKQNLDKAENTVAAAAMGEASVEELALSVANAETSLKAIVAVRDRIVSAYQDIIRMPV